MVDKSWDLLVQIVVIQLQSWCPEPHMEAGVIVGSLSAPAYHMVSCSVVAQVFVVHWAREQLVVDKVLVGERMLDLKCFVLVLLELNKLTAAHHS
jgi:hypothetical protein